jgi:hypothetical protein
MPLNNVAACLFVDIIFLADIGLHHPPRRKVLLRRPGSRSHGRSSNEII